jgi:Caspase domain
MGSGRDELSLLDGYYTNSHAIVIGISEYQQIGRLPNAYNDAKGIERTLREKCGFKSMITLYSQEATYSALREIIIDILQGRQKAKITSQDRVLVYYAGHGILNEVNRNDNIVKEGFIIPYDAREGAFHTYLEMDGIVRGCQSCLRNTCFLYLIVVIAVRQFRVI